MSLRPNGFICESYLTLKQQITLMLFELFQAIEKDRTLTNSFDKANKTLIPKSNNNSKK